MNLRILALLFLISVGAGCTGDPNRANIESNESQAAEMMVEVKVMLAAADAGRAGDVMHLDKDEADIKNVYFFDTPKLTWFDSGLILRARNVEDGHDDSTVKMRPLRVDEVDEKLFDLDDFKCEIDQLGDNAVSSCSLNQTVKHGDIDRAASHSGLIETLFSPDQLAFLKQSKRFSAVDWSALRVLGPVKAATWKVKLRQVSKKLSVERWDLPDGKRMLEVSARVNKGDVQTVRRELEVYFNANGLALDLDQETKTRLVLKYFAAQVN